MGIQVMLGDCCAVNHHIENNSVDLVLTDLPYGVTKNKWDSVIPLDEFWKVVTRILKPGGAVVLFGAEPFSSTVRLSNVEAYKYDWKWIKEQGTGQLNVRRRPLVKYEDIMVFNTKTYNPQGLVACNINKAEKFTENYGKQSAYVQKFTNYPTSILEFNRPGLAYRNHPTEKPVSLLEYLIKTYTTKGDLVVDLTMGSGSTGVACVNIGRGFFGIEKELKYYKGSINRIKTAINVNN